jgi:Putative sensor
MERPSSYSVRGAHTAGSIAYLLLSLPLGIFYFVVLITGFSVGIGTVIVWLGIPILFATIAGVWGMAALERSLVAHLLHIDMPAPLERYAESGKMVERFGLKIRDSQTWKSLAYLLIRFPLGIISFCVAVTLLSLCVSLILAPLGYLIATYVLQEAGIHVAHSSISIVWLNTLALQITGTYEPGEFIKAFAYTIVGIALWMPVRALLNGMASLAGNFARVILTSSRSYTMPKEERYGLPEMGSEHQHYMSANL